MSNKRVVSPKVVRVIWTGPYTLEEVLTKTGENDYGVYQVYGRHPVFGRDSLLYIGRAVRQTFAQRFLQHAPWVREALGVTIHLGRLADDDFSHSDGWTEWDQLVCDVEALLIFRHSPPYNSQSIGTYNGQSLHIQNWGDAGDLMQECSSLWLPPRPDDSAWEPGEKEARAGNGRQSVGAE